MHGLEVFGDIDVDVIHRISLQALELFLKIKKVWEIDMNQKKLGDDGVRRYFARFI